MLLAALAYNLFLGLFITLFVIVSLLLILLILIQKGRGGGLASAFGGAGGQTAFGSKTGDVLTWATSIIFGIFIVLGVALNLLCNHVNAARYPTAGSTALAAPAEPNDGKSSLPKAATGDPGI